MTLLSLRSALSLFVTLTITLLFNTAAAVDESELLQAEQAFQYSLQLDENNTLLAHWMIADGYYVYKDKLKLGVSEGSSLKIGEPIFPPSTRLEDPTFGDVEIFRNKLTVRYPITGLTAASASDYIKAKYQGCADLGVCYPPIRKKTLVSELAGIASNTTNGSTSTATQPAIIKNAANSSVLSEQDAIAESLSSDNFALTLLTFFGFGLLLAFTPCVFPMIPILSGIIIGQGDNISTRQAFSLSLAYVLAMASAYTIVGILAALFGTNLQIWFQTPWILSSFAVVFVLLALSMFGFYELQMPSAIQSKINSLSNRQESGKLISAAVMGFLSALIVGPCVTAPLVGALIYIGHTGDVVLGGSALFVLALGMGAPLLLIGSSAGKLLPRAGAWMEPIKAVFGVLLLGVAIWLLDRVLPPLMTQCLVAILLITSGVYMGALRQHSNDTKQWQLFWKSIGLLVLLYGMLMIIGVSTGRSNLLYPLTNYSTSSSHENTTVNTAHLDFTKVKSLHELNTALDLASQSGSTVMLDFYADWCISCKEMEALTFTDKNVQTALSNTVSLQADVTENDEIDKTLLKHFGIIGPPAILFFDSQGQEIRSSRVVGFIPAEKFASHVNNSLNTPN